MQTTKKLFTLLIAGSVIMSLACSKNTEPTYTVEYRIENADNDLRYVKYMDASKTLVSLSNAADFPGGSKSIRVTKPFVAELEVYAENRSLQPGIYELIILVDGVPKANKTLYVGILDWGLANLQFSVE